MTSMTHANKRKNYDGADSVVSNKKAEQQAKSDFDDDEERPFDRENKIKTLFIILIPLTIVDMITRESLFDWSLPVLLNIRQNYATPSLDFFFSVVSLFGDKIGFIASNVVSYYFMDLEKSFTVALINYSSIALLSFLKSANHEPRPFHVAQVQPSKCTFEFGNPSGHALWTTSVYLAMFDLICQQNGWKYGERKHTMSLTLAIVTILLTCVSRIWHAVHTLNQLFSGIIWGYGLYYLFCYILYYEIRRFVQSVRTRSMRRLVFNFGTKNFCVLILLGIAMYFIGSKLNPQPKEWEENIKQNCSAQVGMNNLITDANLYNFEKFLNCLGIFGNYLGLIIEQRLMGTHVYPLWNQVSFVNQVLLLVLTAPSLIFVSSGSFLIDKTKHSYPFMVIFKSILPSVLGNMQMFAITKWLALKTNLINKNGKKIDSDQHKSYSKKL